MSIIIRAATFMLVMLAAVLLGTAGGAGADPLRDQATAVFGTLPADAASEARPRGEARVELGRMLYYDARLSKNHDIACNSCHQLDRFGVDGEATSLGHRGQRGGRNSPTVYNAALHLAQFWDGRAADVEEQAKGPVLNPIEMAMPSEEAVVGVLKSIPGYAPLFAAAFPGEAESISYDNMAGAIGAFERGLLTPSSFDDWLAGDDTALSGSARRGLEAFLGKGCASCHSGEAIGGGMYRKLRLVKPYATQDKGREAVTGDVADRHVFKVPSLRNVAKTGPWFHDGSIGQLEKVVELMARHQLGAELDAQTRSDLVAFLESLTGRLDAAAIARPELPASGPGTPAPDPG